ncbi:LLM class flavin-dependent oxidoreductase [Plantactinospora sp. KLBMP9567]|uniref:LLM class flavin-dependent oxidoreductase n=1 Tax=Plantactinospora sp. KLBMP9567 TaxID=3085900 RepID=UPI002981C2E1|nr:LLM class flavin-dependent oxidoreductase [Plantactinospora sp. KLBMP9567]MDW5326733.1 LLM class flavin-dependent oxidoreductase [Plantactinospora sp. KLBMP9567]
MPDYGHEVLFGTFITPRADDPDRVVTLAELTEAAGLDLATFQDHPYNPGFLDTWTQLSWVASRTQRLRVSANVLNLSLCPPALLARAAASLDLLSKGRFELGLGAGAMWDGIEGMGGRRLTPGQGVHALREAIEILRGVWDTANREPLRHDGRHYQVPGMRRGPAPAHDIGIWLGAYRPRMLELTDAVADGWLPTLEYLQSPDRFTANRIIDRGAEEAGRDLRQIRRLLNLFQVDFTGTSRGFLQGPPEQWVEKLLLMVLDEGFSVFIIGRDDPRLIQTFGQEVAPALREAVARERAGAGTPTGPIRPAVVLAKRQPGLDYDALPAPLAAHAVEPGDHDYGRVRHSYIRRGSPALVLRPGDAAEAVHYARDQGVPLSVRSGGHGSSGRSTNDGGIGIDLSRMNRVEVLDPARRIIRLEPGARWGEVAQALTPHGLAMSSGDYGDVGGGGLGTTAGVGFLARKFLARKYGLTIDHVVAAQIGTADGGYLRTDKAHHPDLFWAIRGAGGNFGVVTALELEAYEVGDVAVAQLTVDADDTAGLLTRWGALVEQAPRELSSFLPVFASPRGPMARVTLVYAGDDAEAAQAALTPFVDIGPIIRQQAQIVPYAALVAPSHNRHHGQGLEQRAAAPHHRRSGGEHAPDGALRRRLGDADPVRRRGGQRRAPRGDRVRATQPELLGHRRDRSRRRRGAGQALGRHSPAPGRHVPQLRDPYQPGAAA